LIARRILVHCLPLNELLPDVSKFGDPSFLKPFLAPPPLKKHKQDEHVDAKTSFEN